MLLNIVWCILALILTLNSFTHAANPIKFCKCVCGTNSTILALPMGEPKPCLQCTKDYCINHALDGICDGLNTTLCPSEKDFSASCFARDSYKDEAIVTIFLIITLGLLVAAIIKPHISDWKRQVQSRSTYSSMPNAGSL